MWKFRHIWKIDFLSQYKNIARVFRKTTYFHAVKNRQSYRGKIKRRHARKYFPWGAKTWLYDAILSGLFWRRFKKINKHQKIKISVRRQNSNVFLHTKTRILHKKTSACLRSISWLCQCRNRFPKYSVDFANTLSIFLRYIIFLKNIVVLVTSV